MKQQLKAQRYYIRSRDFTSTTFKKYTSQFISSNTISLRFACFIIQCAQQTYGRVEGNPKKRFNGTCSDAADIISSTFNLR